MPDRTPRPPGPCRSLPAFTLTELVVSLAIAVIAAMLGYAGLESIRTRADDVACAARLKGLGQALAAYAWAHEGWLPDTGAASTLAGAALPAGHHADTWDFPGSAAWPEEPRTGNAGNLYLLVRLGQAKLQDFICPCSGDRPAFGPRGSRRTGFLDCVPGSTALSDRQRDFLRSHATRHCSYSYQNMLGHPGQSRDVADPAAAGVHIELSPSDLVVLADHNPYTELKGENRPRLDPQRSPLANSLNHAGRGQNVLRLDLTVTWETTPECGARLADGRRDNIYRPARGEVRDPRNVPRERTDSYLVP